MVHTIASKALFWIIPFFPRLLVGLQDILDDGISYISTPCTPQTTFDSLKAHPRIARLTSYCARWVSRQVLAYRIHGRETIDEQGPLSLVQTISKKDHAHFDNLHSGIKDEDGEAQQQGKTMKAESVG